MSSVPGIPARPTLAPQLVGGRGARLPQVDQVVQKCGLCEGAKQLPRAHGYWLVVAERSGAPDALAEAMRLYEQYHGRCPGCGGHGKVIIMFDKSQVVRYPNGRVGPLVLGFLHYDDRGVAPDELAYLKKMNPSA